MSGIGQEVGIQGIEGSLAKDVRRGRREFRDRRHGDQVTGEALGHRRIGEGVALRDEPPDSARLQVRQTLRCTHGSEARVWQRPQFDQIIGRIGRIPGQIQAEPQTSAGLSESAYILPATVQP